MRQKKKMAGPLFCFLLFAVLLVLACNNNTPIAARSDLINRGDIGNILRRSQIATMDSSAGKVINTRASFFLLLGELKNVESRILLRFDPLPDSGQVIAAKLLLPADSLANGQAGNFEATVHQVTSAWSEAEVVWGEKDFPVTFNPAEMDKRSIAAPKSDTVFFDLSPQVVAKWFSSQGANRDTFGVMIKPQAASFLKELHSRFSTQKQPALEMNLRTRIGGRDTTIVSRRSATASVFVFKRTAPLPNNHLYVGNGERYQSVLAFDLSAIIPDTIPQSATVNRATLTLQTDAVNSLFADSDNVLAFSLYYSLKKFKLDTLNLFTADSLVFLQESLVNASQSLVEFGLTSLVQGWVRTPPELRIPPQNYGYLYLLPDFPSSTFSRMAFYSRHEGASRAPSLKIEYTTPPNSQ